MSGWPTSILNDTTKWYCCCVVAVFNCLPLQYYLLTVGDTQRVRGIYVRLTYRLVQTRQVQVGMQHAFWHTRACCVLFPLPRLGTRYSDVLITNENRSPFCMKCVQKYQVVPSHCARFVHAPTMHIRNTPHLITLQAGADSCGRCRNTDSSIIDGRFLVHYVLSDVASGLNRAYTHASINNAFGTNCPCRFFVEKKAQRLQATRQQSR